MPPPVSGGCRGAQEDGGGDERGRSALQPAASGGRGNVGCGWKARAVEERVGGGTFSSAPSAERTPTRGPGFAKTLFYLKSNPQVMRLGAGFRPAAAANFYHSMSQRLWILIGTDSEQRAQMFAQVPEASGLMRTPVTVWESPSRGG